MNNNPTNTDTFAALIEDESMEKDYAEKQLRHLLADLQRFVDQSTKALDGDLHLPTGFDLGRMATNFELRSAERMTHARAIRRFTKLQENLDTK